MIVPSRWIRKWLLFAHLKLGEEPGPIDMISLLTKDGSDWRPKRTLLPPCTKFGEERPGHFRYIFFIIVLKFVGNYILDCNAL
jgi:hypothetical protein